MAPKAVEGLSGPVLRLLHPGLASLPSALMRSARVTVVTNFSRSGDSRHAVEWGPALFRLNRDPQSATGRALRFPTRSIGVRRLSGVEGGGVDKAPTMTESTTLRTAVPSGGVPVRSAKSI